MRKRAPARSVAITSKITRPAHATTAASASVHVAHYPQMVVLTWFVLYAALAAMVSTDKGTINVIERSCASFTCVLCSSHASNSTKALKASNNAHSLRTTTRRARRPAAWRSLAMVEYVTMQYNGNETNNPFVQVVSRGCWSHQISMHECTKGECQLVSFVISSRMKRFHSQKHYHQLLTSSAAAQAIVAMRTLSLWSQ